jgi:DNA polymerase-3 subunit chi
MINKDISIYEINNAEIFDKTICQIVEKCYSTGMHTLVVVEDDGYKQILNKTLWTFSQKSFIPHSTDDDLMPEKQPILITSNFKNLNRSSILVIVGRILEIDSEAFEKIIHIFCAKNSKHEADLNKLKSNLKPPEYKYFVMDEKGSWIK